jgi:DNA-binding protein YbaB
VQGRTSGGGQFSCSIDGDGRIRNVSIDGRAV